MSSTHISAAYYVSLGSHDPYLFWAPGLPIHAVHCCDKLTELIRLYLSYLSTPPVDRTAYSEYFSNTTEYSRYLDMTTEVQTGDSPDSAFVVIS